VVWWSPTLVDFSEIRRSRDVGSVTAGTVGWITGRKTCQEGIPVEGVSSLFACRS